MKKVINPGFLAIILLLCSCKKQLKPADYVQYIKDSSNGLLKTTTIDGWQYSMQYKPADYIIFLESAGNYTDSFVKEERNRLKGTVWFDISIRRADAAITPLKYDVSSLDEYNGRLSYFLNRAQDDIQLIYKTDTIKPMSYLFENGYNLTPQETMIVGFILPGKDATPSSSMQLRYRDRIFKNGIIKSTYAPDKITHIPDLIF